MDPAGLDVLSHSVAGDDRMLLLAISAAKGSARYDQGNIIHLKTRTFLRQVMWSIMFQVS